MAIYHQQLKLYSTFAKRLQIDIVDGRFVSSKTIELKDLTPFSPDGPAIDIHLMALQPSLFLPDLLRLRPSLCILHAEASENLLPLIENLKSQQIKVGIALLQHTYPPKAAPYLKLADHALIFAGQLGQQGGQADLLQTEKPKLIRTVKPELEIGWDGGVNLQNIRTIAHSGLEVINVGSFLSASPDPAAAYQALQEEIEKPGVNI